MCLTYSFGVLRLLSQPLQVCQYLFWGGRERGRRSEAARNLGEMSLAECFNVIGVVLC